MSDTASSPEELPKDKGLFSKHKWRGKLFASETFGKSKHSKESTEDDVAQFLQGSGARKDEAAPRQTVSRPRIDTASASSWSPEDPTGESLKVEDRYHRPKPRQNKGLHVSFANPPPEIIGEGGDEAELPSRDVLVSTAQPTAESPPPSTPQPRPTVLDNDPVAADKGVPQRQQQLSGVSQEMNKHLKRPQLMLQSDLPPQPSRQQHTVSPESVYSEKSEPPSVIDAGVNLGLPSPMSSSAKTLTPWASPRPPAGPQVSSPLIHKGQSLTENDENRTPFDPRPSSRTETEGRQGGGWNALRNASKTLGVDASDDFDFRVRRFYEIFRLGIAAHQDVMRIPFARWIQTAVWWFLKGRGELESAVRSRPRSDSKDDLGHPQDVPPDLKQAYVNLAKAWWIAKEVSPNHPELSRFGKSSMSSMATVIRRFGAPVLATLVETNVSLVANMRALAMSMKRNGKLPPDSFEIQGRDTRVLYGSHGLPEDVSTFVSARPRHDALSNFPIPLSDSENHFNLGRMFAEVVLTSRQKLWERIHIPCIVSILRKKTSLNITLLIANQSGQVNLTIPSEGTRAHSLTWKNVHWRPSSYAFYISLSEDVEFSVQLSEKDFRTLGDTYEQARKVQKDFEGRDREDLVYECRLHTFDSSQSSPPPNSFPREPIKDCKARIFARSTLISDGAGNRTIDNGYRLVVATPTNMKNLSALSQEYGANYPMIFFHHSREGEPVLTLKLPFFSTLVLSFRGWDSLDLFCSTLSGYMPFDGDSCSPYLSLHSLTVQDFTGKEHDPSYDPKPCQCYLDLHWHRLRVVERSLPPPNFDPPPPVHRGGILLMILQGDYGQITDKLNLAPGELQVSLDVDDINQIKLFRPLQQDILMTLNEPQVPQDTVQLALNAMQKFAKGSSLRTYRFRSLADLHIFQEMVTHFTVQYDGMADNFAISRRRMVVPIHKRWEVDSARLQILRRGKTVHLIGFFKNCTWGASINFVLKVTDFFETFSKSGVFYLRIVDAKFAMPKGGQDPTQDYVCLDIPEYPGEHDDITIGFNNENERNKFASFLPGTVDKASRMGSLRR